MPPRAVTFVSGGFAAITLHDLPALIWSESTLLQILSGHTVNVDRILAHSPQSVAAVLKPIPVGLT